MPVHSFALPQARLTRIGYLDIPVPAELLGLTAEQVAAVPWAAPTWADENRPLLGNAAWFADVGDLRIVFDPLQTLDVVLRPDRESERTHQDAVAALFADSGFPVESVDLVVMTHIDGVGMAARRDDSESWAPYFPKARILMSDVELAGFRNAQNAGDAAPDLVRSAWSALIDAGLVHTYRDGDTLAPGLVADVSGGHGPGHTVLHFEDHGKIAFSLIGHRAVTPVQLATGECTALNEDPAEAWRLLHENARDGRMIAGSLWPTPGHGRWIDGTLRSGGE
jgi:glyoxylase-like metal-dependent hydrolase (beta-lactamase superfamily II)